MDLAVSIDTPAAAFSAEPSAALPKALAAFEYSALTASASRSSNFTASNAEMSWEEEAERKGRAGVRT